MSWRPKRPDTTWEVKSWDGCIPGQRLKPTPPADNFCSYFFLGNSEPQIALTIAVMAQKLRFRQASFAAIGDPKQTRLRSETRRRPRVMGRCGRAFGVELDYHHYRRCHAIVTLEAPAVRAWLPPGITG